MVSRNNSGAVTPAEGKSRDELARDLLACATLVKKGEYSPLLHQALMDLKDYVAVHAPKESAAERRPSGAAERRPSSTRPTTTTVAAHATAETGKQNHKSKGWLHHGASEWCETHFTYGCSCQVKKEATNRPPAANHPKTHRKAFQRPANPNSALIATGWMEQQRRSRMRTVWKQILASLVEARKPGEDTTLWIQREVVNTSNSSELEALHQIPVKWLENVTYEHVHGEHRIIIRVYNLPEDFLFRTVDEDAAQSWVLTLRSAKDAVQQKKRAEKTAAPTTPATTGVAEATPKIRRASVVQEEKKLPDKLQQEITSASSGESNTSPKVAGPAPPDGSEPSSMSIRELRAIVTGAGIETKGMERSGLERVATEVLEGKHKKKEPERKTVTPPPETTKPPPAAAAAAPVPPKPIPVPKPAQPPPKSAPAATERPRLTIKELRSIAHGEGINTIGMERADLEAAVAKVFESKSGPPQKPDPAKEEAHRQAQAAAGAAMRQRQEAEMRQRQEAAMRQRDAEQKRLREEEERRALEAERLRRDHEEYVKRVADHQAAEARRKQEEALRQQQQQWQQQQQQWQQHQAAEQRAAEERRRQAHMQQWQQQQQHHHAHQQHAQPQQQRPPYGMPPQQQQHHHPQQQQWQQRPQTPQQAHPGYGQPQRPPPQQQQPPQQQRPPPPQASPASSKYAKMAAEDSSQSTAAIKHGVLVSWALQPPTLQALRPIEVLLTTIHTVFPPKFGVAGHEYFGKWTAVQASDVKEGNRPDEEKLRKVVRKLRFFLHPDKLPKDLSETQTFMCKMLWDISNDAYEEHKKKTEELGWIHN